MFRRSLPPRLAQHADATGEQVVIRLVGPKCLETAVDMDLPIPDPGELSASERWTVGRPKGEGPFALQISCSADAALQLERELTERGCWVGDEAVLELARVLSGWPRLGAEIDAKTLPQEVRFDEHDGVSHSKGCYVGQETVARLHFRGHTNRRLVGLVWSSLREVVGSEVERDGRSVGRVSSVAWIGVDDRHAGLGVVRREVDLGVSVAAAGARATVRDLPQGTAI
jgi:folate-binding protein YgfZ